MKKLLLIIAIVSASLIVKADEFVRVNFEVSLTKSELLKEIKYRNSKLQEYKKLGYSFEGMVTNTKGKFMRFVK